MNTTALSGFPNGALLLSNGFYAGLVKENFVEYEDFLEYESSWDWNLYVFTPNGERVGVGVTVGQDTYAGSWSRYYGGDEVEEYVAASQLLPVSGSVAVYLTYTQRSWGNWVEWNDEGEEEWYTYDDSYSYNTLTTVSLSSFSVSGIFADNEILTGTEDTALTISVADLLAGDASWEGRVLSIAGVGGALNGTVVLDDRGTASKADDRVVFTPGANFNGTASFTYTVVDGFGKSDVATVTVEVAAVNDAPTVQAIAAGTVTENDAAKSINLLAGQSDVEGQALSAIAISVVDALGRPVVFTDNGNGTISIDPIQFSGLEDGESLKLTVSYKVSDGAASSANTATLTVTGISDELFTYGETVSGTVAEFLAYPAIAHSPGDMTGEVALQLLNRGNLDLSARLQGMRGATVTASSLGNTITTGNKDDRLNGSLGNDSLFGGAGNDAIQGGAGNNLMVGGLGNDSFTSNTSGFDVVDGGEGLDLLRLIRTGSSQMSVFSILDPTVEQVLADGTRIRNVEQLEFRGGSNADRVTGGALADVLEGGGGNDQMVGGAGADVLLGGEGGDTLNGGAGADRMEGGNGSDAFFVDDAADQATDEGVSGKDIVYTTVNYTLLSGIENLTLKGTAVQGQGNSLNNALLGNAENNILHGGGGADDLRGAIGNDTLYGGEGADKLNGGTGADRMEGGGGADKYTVDNTADQVVELAGAGTDQVSASASFSLSDNVENLTLTGTAALNGTGNALANNITGNSGVNVLRGEGGRDRLSGGGGNDELRGGLDNDQLLGGAGADRFVFDTAPHSSSNMDKITDFARTDGDRILLDDAVYTALQATAGGDPSLLASQFVLGSAATTGEHRIIYNQSLGKLFYDADGAGGAAQLQFAALAAGTALTAADLWVA